MKRKVKRFWFLAYMTLVVLPFCVGGVFPAVSSVSAEETASPAVSLETAAKAVVENARFNFGAVLEGEQVKHTFFMENKGKTPLEIIKVKTTCGCTTTKHPKQIAPGVKEEIVVKVRTEGYGGRRFDKTIVIHTNDPQNPTTPLTIEGDVDLFARIEPEYVVLKGSVETDIQAEVFVTQQKRYPFKIVGVETDGELKEALTVSLAPQEKENGRYRIYFKNKQKKAGKYRGRVVLQTDSSIHPELYIHVTGNIGPKSHGQG